MIEAPPTCAALLLHLSGPPSRTQQALEDDGIWVTGCFDPSEARHRLQTLRPDLLVLEVDGRQAEDWQVCQELAAEGISSILALVADGSAEIRLAALASGADDVLAAPIHPLELLARVRALLRRSPSRPDAAAVLRHGDLELDLDAHLATLTGRHLALTPLEFRLLRTLLENPNRTFSREDLLTRVHGFDDRLPSDRSIDLHVTELRHKLGDPASTPAYIETVRGLGYRLARASRREVRPSTAAGGLAQRAALVLGGGAFSRAVHGALASGGARLLAAGPWDDVEVSAAELSLRGFNARAFACDPTRREGAEAAVAAALDTLGGLDVLVWCAGPTGLSAPLRELTAEQWEQALDAQLSSAFYAIHAALPALSARPFGRLVLVSPLMDDSGRAVVPSSGPPALGLVGLVRGLAAEAAGTGLTVNLVSPRSAGAPRGRAPGADAVARAVAWLCDAAASDVNGQTIELSG